MRAPFLPIFSTAPQSYLRYGLCKSPELPHFASLITYAARYESVMCIMRAAGSMRPRSIQTAKARADCTCQANPWKKSMTAVSAFHTRLAAARHGQDRGTLAPEQILQPIHACLVRDLVASTRIVHRDYLCGSS